MNTPIQIIVAIILAGASFYGGMQYQVSVQAATQAERQAQRGAFGGQARGGQGLGGGVGRGAPVSGKVIAKDETTLTLEVEGGGSKIVILSNDTRVTHSTQEALTDVDVGETVRVMGTTNTDGSVTANRVETGTLVNFSQRTN